MFRSLKKILKYPRLTLKYPAKPLDSSKLVYRQAGDRT